jgi:D-alanyl-D-alanine carboxypeptidase
MEILMVFFDDARPRRALAALCLALILLTAPRGAAGEALDSYLICVNKQTALPEDYVPADLRAVDVPFSNGASDERRQLRAAAADALEMMFRAAEGDGVLLRGFSGYRSYESQRAVYRRGARAGNTDSYIAKPGHSEHQTGLSMDVGGMGNRQLEAAFAGTDAGKWVAENAHKYGFIVRYPAGGEALTGYAYEPWHLRYVGEAAPRIYETGLVLEQYLECLKDTRPMDQRAGIVLRTYLSRYE